MSSEGKTRATLGHICIEVSDLRNSRKFYEVLLGKLDSKVIMDTKETIGFSNEVFNVWLVECGNQELGVSLRLGMSLSWLIT